jgi:hypothetical protein
VGDMVLTMPISVAIQCVAHAAWIEHFLPQYKIFRLAFALLSSQHLGFL